MQRKPTVCGMVHYVSYGTDQYASGCQAAIVTSEPVLSTSPQVPTDVSLTVFRPTGTDFVQSSPQDEDGHSGGSWHWPEDA